MSSIEKTYTHIRDGYTRKGYISGIDRRTGDRLSGELRFTYRPMLPAQREFIRRALRDEKGPKADEIFVAAVAQQLCDWSATDDEGRAVPVNVVNVRRLPPHLYDKIYMVIAGIEASDPEPQETTEQPEDYATQFLRAGQVDAAPGDLLLSEQQKNS